MFESVPKIPSECLSTFRNVVSIGPPGVAMGLGLKAVEHRYRVLFTTAAAMLAMLSAQTSHGGQEIFNAHNWGN